MTPSRLIYGGENMTTFNGVDLSKLGIECKKFRQEMGYTQTDVAKDLDLSRELISGFECGRSKNLYILSWYIDRGFDYVKSFKG